MAARDGATYPCSYATACPKLEDTTEGGGGGHADEEEGGHVVVVETAGRHRQTHTQGNGPEIEGKVGDARHQPMQTRQVAARESGGKERTDEHGEDMQDELRESRAEGLAGMRMENGDNGGYEQGNDDIDKNGVGRDIECVATEFARDNYGCGGRGANHANHKRLNDDGPIALNVIGHECRNEKAHTLNEQGQKEVAAHTKAGQLHLAEGGVEHQEDEPRLCGGDDGAQFCAIGMEQFALTIEYVEQYAYRHGNGEHPSFQKTFHRGFSNQPVNGLEVIECL